MRKQGLTKANVMKKRRERPIKMKYSCKLKLFFNRLLMWDVASNLFFSPPDDQMLIPTTRWSTCGRRETRGPSPWQRTARGSTSTTCWDTLSAKKPSAPAQVQCGLEQQTYYRHVSLWQKVLVCLQTWSWEGTGREIKAPFNMDAYYAK